MYRSSKNPLDSRQSPLNISGRSALNALVMKSSSARTSHSSSTASSEESDNDTNNQTLRKFITGQPLNPTRSRSSSHSSLKSMIIEGQWKYREDDNDRRRLKALGIEHLVNICQDIMRETSESIVRKKDKQKKLISTNELFSIVKLDKFKKLTDTERSSLRRAKLFDLMTIVYQATSTSASISQLVRIWREASEHNFNRRASKKPESRPLISYEGAFEHLIRTPNDQLLRIALHASLLSTHNQSDLRRLGQKLAIDRHEFDIESIRDSSKAFEHLIQFLREQKRKQKRIDTTRLLDKQKKKRGLYANVSGTRFRLICQAVDISGFYISPDPDFTSNLLWNDTLISMDIVSALKPYQKVNHFPTMNEISRKDLLAKNYDRLSNLLPKKYNFAPKTWILPSEYNLWYSYAANQPKKDPFVYIMKPTNASMSQGIAIHCDYKQIKSMDNYIIQEYIREPYLIDGFKFDLRIYALITSCDPLRVFIFNDGLIRMCSKKYATPTPRNALDLSMHLTNYSLDNEDHFHMDETRRTRTLKSILEYLKEQKQDEGKLWKEIQVIVLKTIFLAAPHLLTAYRKCRPGTLPTSESVCFELLGFDILIDKNLKPWIVEVNRCPNFDFINQMEFDLKIKLLFDTFDLLRFRTSDRKKSMAIEKIEAQHRLYTSLGKQTNHRTDELQDLKENLSLLRREKSRKQFENHHSHGYIRLFPIDDDEKQMNEMMDLLTRCFEVLAPKQMDFSKNMKYFHRFNEQELLNDIVRLEEKNQIDVVRRVNDVIQVSNNIRQSSSIYFTFESSDEEYRSRSLSPRSGRKKTSSSRKIDSPIKQVSTQTPSDISRAMSSTSINLSKTHSYANISTGTVTRPQAESHQSHPGVSAVRITEKRAYTPQSSSYENLDQQRSPSAKTRKSNDKSQLVTYSSIIRETREHLADQLPTKDVKKELQLTDKDLHRLHQLTLKEMNELCIHYPNKSDRETDRICIEIVENWNYYKSDIGRFWLAELDTEKRQSVIEIVWNNVQQIMKKVCVVDDLIQQLPLNRHLIKLKRRLLANHGQPFWDACLNRHSSWESLFVKSTNHLSTIELDCCYRFVDLCQEALFIVYHYFIADKQQKIHRGLSIIVQS